MDKRRVHKILYIGEASGNNSLCGLWEAYHGSFKATIDNTKVTCQKCKRAIVRKSYTERSI
jgi:hypothetical protein